MLKPLSSDTVSCHTPSEIIVAASSSTSRWPASQRGRHTNRYDDTRQRYVRTVFVRLYDDRVVAFQASLFDGGDEPSVGPLTPRRTALSEGAWIDIQRGWIGAADVLFE